jgi:outer membrane receptor protein involved in Fe transport
MSKHLLLFFVCLFPVLAHAQTATIKGTVRDALTKEVIIGANVAVDGTTTGSSTDLDGNFAIKIAPGTYKIKITYVSYKPQLIENVACEVGKVAQIDAFIEEDSKTLEEVGITAQRQTNTIVALVNEIKFAESVVVGISGDQIQKTQDRDAGQVVRRIPGVSVVDDRFIVVRGLGARYNTVMLNDVLTPSSEVDVKSFSFDMVPSGVIDRITISKSGAAELPGEFAGGLIKIYTKTPDENQTSISLSTGFRANTTFNNVARFSGASNDVLGLGASSRSLPGTFPSPTDFRATSSPLIRAVLAQGLANNWVPEQSAVSPDLRLGVNLTRKFNIGKLEVGNLTAISYSNTHQYAFVEQSRYNAFDPITGVSSREVDYNDDFYTNNVRLGVLHNWTFRLNDKNKFEFRNLFNQMGASETTVRNGIDYVNTADLQNYAARYEQRSIYSGQLSGKHNFGEDNKANFTWNVGYGFTDRQEPDFRRFRSQRVRGGGTDARFEVQIPPGATLFDAARFYSKLSEQLYMASGNYEHKVQLGKDKGLITKLRAGFYLERKNRTFDARWFSYTRANLFNFDNGILRQPISQIFSIPNVNGTTGFAFAEGTRPVDAYTADNTLLAGYIGAAIPMTKKLNVTVGLRAEQNTQRLQTSARDQQTGQLINVDNPILSLLPSVNLTYDFTEKMLMRLAYSRTINRPEFRELAPFPYYDFNLDFNFEGNPNLKVATIHNVDARWEFYPAQSELISFGAFYKQFQNPIEAVAILAGGGVSRTFGFENARSARNFGVEAEVRKSFYNLSERKFIQDLTFVLNAALVSSRVEFTPEQAVRQGFVNRPLAFQSPYLANVGLYYNNEESNTQINILYNVIGPRIYIVGDIDFPTIYEIQRHVIDLSFTQGIGKKLEIRGGIQDLLNAPFGLTQDSDLNQRITGVDENFQTYRRGQYFNLGLNYKF